MNKLFINILLTLFTIYGQTTVYQYTKEQKAQYASFSAYLTAIGTDNASYEMGKDNTITSSTRILSNIDIRAITGGAKFNGAGTLRIGRFSARPEHQCFDTAGIVQMDSSACTEVYAHWWGNNKRSLYRASVAAAYGSHKLVLSKYRFPVSGKITIPATVDFTILQGACVYGNTGSTTDTLVISKMSARPMHQWIDTSLTVQFAAGAVDEVKPEWFGAKGDGIIDDTKAWKALIVSLPGNYSPAADFSVKNGAIVFCNPQRTYKISDTINISEKWNLTLKGKGRNFTRNYDSSISTFTWYGDTSKPIIFSDYNYGLNIENISVDGRGIAGVIGIQLSIPDTTASNVKYCDLKNIDVRKCNIGMRIGGLDQDDAAITITNFTADNNTSCGLWLESGNLVATVINPHITNNGYSPTGTNKGCNVYIGSGKVDIYGYVSAGSSNTAPIDADIYHAFGTLGIYGAWSDTWGKFLRGGSGSNAEGGVLKGIRHYATSMTDTNTPTSIEVSDKTVIDGCYLFGDIVCNSGNSGSLTILNNKFVSGTTLGTKRPDSGVGRYKGTIVTTQRGLVEINNQGNQSRIMAGGGSRTNFNPHCIGYDQPFLGLFGKNLVESIGPTSGDAGYVITGPNVSNGGFEFWINCYSSDGGATFKAYKVGFAKRYNWSFNGPILSTYYFADTTSAVSYTSFVTVSQTKGTGDVSTPLEFALFPPQKNGTPVYSSGSYWRGGIMFDTSDNRPKISRTGTTTFSKFLLESDTASVKKITSTDTTNSTSTGTGCATFAGGIAVTKNIWSGAKIQSGDTLRTGNASSYAQLDSVNGLLLAGNATVWDDIRIVPGSTDRPGTSDPSLVPYGATYLWEYEKNDSSTFIIQLPHGYKAEDSIFSHAHWTPGTRGNEEGTATVGWKIGYSWSSIDSVFPAFAVVDLFDSCKSTDGQHLMTPEVGIPGPGKTKSSMLLCNFKRTDTGADDTWAGTASGQLPFLLEIDFHIPLNKLGSPTR